MDMSAVLAYKSLFLANRARGTVEQAVEGRNCTAIANGARVAVTASQGIVPLFAVSDCLAKTTTNETLKRMALNVANSPLKSFAATLGTKSTVASVGTITGITKVLSKLGIATNIAYAAAKCMDAKEENKTEVFLTASGNCAGMYLFEKIYSSLVKQFEKNPKSINLSHTSNIFQSSLPFLKSVKGTSVLVGLGFVFFSLLGCKFGEKVAKSLYNSGVCPDKKVT